MSIFQIGLGQQNDERCVTEMGTMTFKNNRINVPRIGDILLPYKILCRGCSPDFSITSIKITGDDRHGDNVIVSIDDTEFFNFVDFVETDEDFTIYHLDRTKLFFNLYLVAIQFGNIMVNITTEGNADSIDLCGKWTHKSTKVRNRLASKRQEELVNKIFTTSLVGYKSNEEIAINVSNTNGIIITGIDPSLINSIKVFSGEYELISYPNKGTIRACTSKINNDTLYVNFNDCHLSDKITHSTILNPLKMMLGINVPEANFKVGCYYTVISVTGDGYMSVRDEAYSQILAVKEN